MQKNTANKSISVKIFLCWTGMLLFFNAHTIAFQNQTQSVSSKIAIPPKGKFYHGVYPGGKSGSESDITIYDVKQYQYYAGKKVAWVYFSNNWFESRKFPTYKCNWIIKLGAVPFIRLMLRSSLEENRKEKLYTLDAIINGKFDNDLILWGKSAKRVKAPLIVEYGTECNGNWFPWNGQHNGADTLDKFGDKNKADGPERFVYAFRHIVKIIRSTGANNITWVFHINADDCPSNDWNKFENYYPGDDFVDWTGISVYGALTPMDDKDDIKSFREKTDSAYRRLIKLAPHKPIAILEFGCCANNKFVKPDIWAKKALEDIFSYRWPKLIGFAWWNERWENDDNPKHNTTMRLQDIPELAKTFHKMLNDNANKIIEHPIILNPKIRNNQ